MEVLRLLIPTLMCGWASAAPSPSPNPSSNPSPNPSPPPQPTPIPAGTNPYWMTSNGDSTTTCEGFEQVESPCEPGPPCQTCAKSVNCVWGEWGHWSGVGQFPCDQLCERKRNVKTSNNACGTPCAGTSTESKRCAPSAGNFNCGGNLRDCAFNDWADWNTCATDNGQQTRVRHMVPAASGGKPCQGPSSMTQACGLSSQKIDCAFSDWQPWTECSSTCGQGQRTRTRRFDAEAENGGAPCDGELQHIGACEAQSCAGVTDCEASDWAEWMGCAPIASTQQFRVRAILKPNSAGGAGCPANIKETKPCPNNDVCTFNSWLQWSVCDKACGGGQMRRSRVLKHWLTTSADWDTRCPNSTTQETQGCNTQICTSASKDCQISAWTAWKPCRPPCGTGMSARTRTITQPAQPGGIGCTGKLEELKPCNNTPCVPVDCVWGLWSQWGACTTTCGGGTAHRTRTIKTKPRYGGKPCGDVPGDLSDQSLPWSEIGPCNTVSCNDVCIDGVWGLWDSWSACSASCDTGFHARRRDLAEVPNACGKPAEGPENEITTCEAPVACEVKRDCKLTSFGQWSACSTSCFGMQERQRLISQFASGGGALCSNESLKEIRPCNPLQDQKPSSSCAVLPHHDCTITEWAPWQDCPVSCGGGQHTRARRIVQPPSGGGKSCNNTLTMTRSCNQNKCGSHCINCKWGQWAEWGACTRCGGQRYRSRRVEQMPNHCGASCVSRVAQETVHCPNLCDKPYWCVWQDWSAPSGCSVTCGNATKQRQRRLEIVREDPGTYLFKSHKNYMCAGTQFEMLICPPVACPNGALCTPQNCIMAQWGQWSAPQSTGLCQRNRVIEQNNNQCPGSVPCGGDLIDTKECIAADSKPRDCELSTWGQWGHCPSMLAQKSRVRGVRRQAVNGGSAAPCTGALRETMSCNKANAPIDCGETEWTVWGACTKTCGGGWMYRTRQANHPSPQFGGAPCAGSLKELSLCNEKSCLGTDRDCILGDWSTYGVCFQDQESRFRGIKQMASGIQGKGCDGNLEETVGCGTGPVDCKVSAWTPWDKCDLDCGGGQQNRHRSIWKHPENGGTACPAWNKETQGCNLFKCTGENSCVLPAWTGWSSCDSTCGYGQRVRTRPIDKIRGTGGAGCLGDTQETVVCGNAPPPGIYPDGGCPPTDCKWADWSAWSACSKSCESGYQTRHRTIGIPASPKGNPCPAEPMKEGQLCNANSCDSSVVCIDGAWEAWTEWNGCTATCGGGINWRTRKVAKTANYCGKVLLGMSSDVMGCKNTTADKCPDANQDCAFGEWNPWGACFETCNSDRKRTRDVDKPGRGTGKPCNGTSAEVGACKPGPGEVRPPNCAVPKNTTKVDCTFNEWGEWAACSAPCGGGYKERSRNYAGDKNGGAPCVGATKSVDPCNAQLCNGSQASVNCEWGDWLGWGVCDACHGVQKRQRMVKKHALRGGTACAVSGSEELSSKGCDATYMPEPFMRYCMSGASNTSTQAKFCTFGEWKPWSPCRATCGNSTRTRKRYLEMATLDTCAKWSCEAPWVSLPDPAKQSCRISDGCTAAQCCTLPTTTYTTTSTSTAAPTTTTKTTVPVTTVCTPGSAGCNTTAPNGSAPAPAPRLYEEKGMHDETDLSPTAHLQEVADMRKARIEGQGQMHMQEVGMAFAAGGACVFLILTGMRVWNSFQRRPDAEGVQTYSSLRRTEEEPLE